MLPVERYAATAAVVTGQLPGPIDLVLSDCLLGQIMHSCRKAMGDSPHLGVVAQAAAMGHLNLLGRLCRPGGNVLLVTDTVSSETYPLEELWASVGNCGNPPRDHSRKFAIVGMTLTVGVWIVVPTLVGLSFLG